MAAPRIKWNLKAFAEIRTLPSVYVELRRRANRIADAAGDGYDVGVQQGGKGRKRRARAAVHTTDFKSIRDNAKNNTLLRNLDAGKG